MKKLIVVFFLCSLAAFGQGSRFGDSTPAFTSGSVPGTPGIFIQAMPDTVLNICSHPANAVPCTNKITTYTDLTLGTSCPTNQQVVLAGTDTCVTTTDGQGNWGAYAPSGNYDYTLTYQGLSFGPYTVSVGGSGGGGDVTLAGDNHFIGSNTFPNINNVLFIDGTVYSCSSAGITAALAALPSTGGTVDARGCQGNISLASTVNISGPDTVLLGAATFKGSSCPIFQLSSEGATLSGLQMGSGDGAASPTVIQAQTGCAGPVVEFNIAAGVRGGRVASLKVDGNNVTGVTTGILDAVNQSLMNEVDHVSIANAASCIAFGGNDQNFIGHQINCDNSAFSGTEVAGIDVSSANNRFITFDNGTRIIGKSRGMVVGTDDTGVNASDTILCLGCDIEINSASAQDVGSIALVRNVRNFKLIGGWTELDQGSSTEMIELGTASSTPVNPVIQSLGIYGDNNATYGVEIKSALYPSVMDNTCNGISTKLVRNTSGASAGVVLGNQACGTSGPVVDSLTGLAFVQGDSTIANNNVYFPLGITANGLADFSAASQLKAPLAAGYASLANSEFGYDSTNNNWHFWVNGADHLMVPLAAGFNTGDCSQPTNSGGTWFLADTGSPCGSGGSGATLQTNGSNNTSQILLNFTNTSGASGITFSNPSGGVESAVLNNTATTVNGQTCTLGSSCTIPHQTGGVNNTSQAGINFITSTVNATGLTITHSNPATNQEKAEATGTVNATSGGTGIDSHTATGVARVSAGTWSVNTALPNDTTTNTQTVGDNSTKIATTAFVLQNAVSNPMTAIGDLIVGTTSGVPARLAVNATAVPETPVSVSGATTLQPAGIPIRASTCPSNIDTIVATDRGTLVTWNDASPCAVGLAQAGTAGFSSNIVFVGCNIGAGTATLTPTISTISYVSGSVFTPPTTSVTISTGSCLYVYSDNTNYFGIVFGTPASGANPALSNLASVNINTSLLFQVAQDLGSATKAPQHIWFYGGGTQTSDPFEITGTATASRTITFPDNTGTVAELNLAQTYSALQTFGTNISIGGVTATGATGTGNNVFSISPAMTGTPDASGATQFKLPVAAAFASLANGEVGYDTTNKNWHGWQNGADALFALFSGSLTTGDCAKIVVSASVTTLQDAGAACGSGGSGTVTSIATTAPIGGGTITTTGTITCTTCVVASSPGLGIAHFAGSTQTATSSLIVAADITAATITGAKMANNTVTATQLAAQYSKGSCTEVWSGSGTASALQSGDDAISNNTCYNDSGVTRTITAVKCRSSAASNTTTVNPTFGSAGTGTTILSAAVTCGNSYAYSSTGTVTNASWTTGSGIDPAMGGTLTGSSIAVIVEYTY